VSRYPVGSKVGRWSDAVSSVPIKVSIWNPRFADPRRLKAEKDPDPDGSAGRMRMSNSGTLLGLVMDSIA
jgi:hypothetical protein